MRKNEKLIMLNGRLTVVPEKLADKLLREDFETDRREKAIRTYEFSKETMVPGPKARAAEMNRPVSTYYFKREYIETRSDLRAEIREVLVKKWGYLGKASNKKKLKVLDVIYVPEGTFAENETRQNTRSRMLVEVGSSWSDKRFMVNIADQIHGFIGNCTKRRAERLLAAAPDYISVSRGRMPDAEFISWAQAAGIM